MTELTTIEQCMYVRNRGFEPLLDPLFYLPIRIRVELQILTFGNPAGGNTAKVNQKFYIWTWEHKQHFCEECGREIYKYSAIHISHIQSKGAHPETAHDPRNVNILCSKCHNKWEFGIRNTMVIYYPNIIVVENLNAEYNCR